MAGSYTRRETTIRMQSYTTRCSHLYSLYHVRVTIHVDIIDMSIVQFYRCFAFVVRNKIQAATIVIAMDIITNSVFQPDWTSAVLLLYRTTVRQYVRIPEPKVATESSQNTKPKGSANFNSVWVGWLLRWNDNTTATATMVIYVESRSHERKVLSFAQ